MEKLAINYSMTSVIPDLTLMINKKISDEVRQQVQDYIIAHKRIFLESNPGLGKTYYFAQLGKLIKKGDNHFKRLIFITPRRIIQDQIEQELLADFSLNGKVKKKNLLLKPTHKIITSTYSSLYKIAEQITDNDLIVVDEAHELLRAYKTPSKPTQYYTKILQTLFNTEASIVLMSGTPVNNFHELLKLKHLTIKKKNPSQTKINIGFSKDKNVNIAALYCERYIRNFGVNALNVIYIKNKNQCEIIASYINDQGYLAKVLTSENKKGDLYHQLSETNTIPISVQFLVTTNVISVGANVLNKNIGGVLMIDENNHLEIKQFSKRFRNAGRFTIDVIGKSFTNKTNEVLNRRKMVFQENGYMQEYCLNQIDDQNKKPQFHSNGYFIKKLNENTFDKDCNTSVYDIINLLIEGFLKNQAFKYNELSSLISTPKLLKNMLNQYDDIEAVDDNFNYKVFNYLCQNVNDTARKSFRNKINIIIDDFINEYGGYLLQCKILLENTDYQKAEIFNNLLEDNMEFYFSDEIEANVNNPLFKRHILEPIYEYIPYLKDIKTCLRFIKKVAPKDRNKHILALYINSLIGTYCDVITKNDTCKLEYKKGSNILQEVNQDRKLLLDLVKLIFEWLVEQEYYYATDLKDYLLAKSSGILSVLIKKKEFPFSMLKNDKEIPANFLTGIVSGIFILESKRSRILDKSTKKRISVYKFNTYTRKQKKQNIIKTSKLLKIKVTENHLLTMI